jgi:predicted O-methyltransferase YrrM
VKETEEQKALREFTAGLEKSIMQISPEQAALMQFLVRLVNARKCIEIGVFTGYSALSVALVLPEDGNIFACDINENWTSSAKKFWSKAGVQDKIDLNIGPAKESLAAKIRQGHEGRFDFVFIDANKEDYDTYYEQCLKLMRIGGLMLIDNTLWEGKVIDPSANDPQTLAIKKLNRKIYNDSRVYMSMIPIGDGLTLVMKK